MRITLSKREQQLIALVSVLAIFILWVYTHYLMVLVKEAGRLGEDVRTAREQVRGFEQIIGNEERVRKQHDEMEQAVNSLRHKLPPEEELSAVIEHLSDLASQTQLKIQTIFPQKTLPEGQLGALKKDVAPTRPIYKITPIQIDALAGYHELGTFLGLVEKSPNPIEVASLRIMANPMQPRRHNVKLVLNVFFAPSTVPKPGTLAVGSSRGGS